MKKNILAIYDTDTEYLTRLMSYILEKRTMPIEVHSFTETGCLKEFIRDSGIDILLITEAGIDDEIEAIAKHELVVLTEGKGPADKKGHRAICKYQSLENIMRELMDYYSEKASPVLRSHKLSSTEFIGFYSPVKRCGTSSLAMAMGQVMADRKKVLYLNLEEYSGFHQLLGENYMMNLSDLLFYIGQKKTNFPCKLAGIVQTKNKMDFIPPVISPLDIRNVNDKTWEKFFSELLDCGYDTVIIDFGSWTEEGMGIFRRCERLFVPVLEDEISKAKIEQFEAMLRIYDSEDILNKMEKIRIPDFAGRSRKTDVEYNDSLRRFAEKLIRQEITAREKELSEEIA